ncbi:Cell cycle serine/threonine-protein kinase cdc5/MSD2 [Coemansia brasiliensis]|uniref:Serine/threonine-protein kinase n=1 Tax=Coemansia brasiliensis TaxID=2650707 RepID=A0A9W8IF01_9FUNG|nr:Cell cycle serine/threonine-protein kinase cdc5/MSD2 [Coemansia brasiliensis]
MATATATAAQLALPKSSQLLAPSSDLFRCPDGVSVPAAFIDQKGGGQAYRIVSLLGRGAFGRCYKVQVVGKYELPHWACKTIDKSTFVGQKVIDRVKYEVRVMRRLPKHESVIEFHHLFEDRDRLYILMEACTSRTVHDLLQRRKLLTEFEARYFIAQVSQGIAALHEARIIHRDIKHSNLLLDQYNRIKIADFGLSTILDTENDRKLSFLGTPNFLAPELVERGGHGFGVDVWAAGILLFIMLYGKPPFSLARSSGGTNLQQLYSRIVSHAISFPNDPITTPSVQNLIQKMCTKDEKSRIQARNVCNEGWFLINADSGVPKFMPDSIFERPIRTLQEYKEAIVGVAKPLTSNKTSEKGRKGKGTAAAMRQPLDTIPENEVRKLPSRTPRTWTRAEDEKENQPVLSIPQPDQQKTRSSAGSHGYALRPRGSAAPAAAASKARAQRTTANDNSASNITASRRAAASRTAAYESAQRRLAGAEVGRVTKLSEDYIPSVQRWKRRLKRFVENTHQYLQRSSSSLEIELNQCQDPEERDYPRVGMYVLNWVILTKYGVGFRLSDGSTMGTLFNDSTSLLKMHNGDSSDNYVYVRPYETSSSIGHYTEASIPPQLEKKQRILAAIEKKIVRDFSAAIDYGIAGDMEPNKVRYPLQMYSTDTAIVFLLMGNVLQFNMNDHSKLFLYKDSHMLYKNGKEKWHFDLRQGPRMLVRNQTINIERFLLCLGYAQRALAQWNLSKP